MAGSNLSHTLFIVVFCYRLPPPLHLGCLAVHRTVEHETPSPVWVWLRCIHTGAISNVTIWVCSSYFEKSDKVRIRSDSQNMFFFFFNYIYSSILVVLTPYFWWRTIFKSAFKRCPCTVVKDTEEASLEMSAENYSVLHRNLSWGVFLTLNNVSSFQIKPFGNASVNDLLCPQIFEHHFSWRSLHCSWIKRNMHSPNPLYSCLAGSIRNEVFKKAPDLNNITDARG